MEYYISVPILNTKLEDDDSPTGGVSFDGETVEDFIKSSKLMNSEMTVSELNQHLVKCGIKPIRHDYKCSGCYRCERRDMKPDEKGYHCTMKDYSVDIKPDDEACVWYWDRAGQEKIDAAKRKKDEEERQKRWSVNVSKPPVKLPIAFDGFGRIPLCPTCHEMPYDTEQCYFCGQRFIQDEEIEEYNSPSPTETRLCIVCGQKTMTGSRSKYNNHFHGSCTNCGTVMME